MKLSDYANILASFAYLKNDNGITEMLFACHKDKLANVMIDSGAFTVYRSKGKITITLDEYCKFIERYERYCEKYVMLDVIDSEKKSKENYLEMVKRGLNPMYVFTMKDNDKKFFIDAVKNNPHVCVAGGVATKGDWVKKRYQEAYSLHKCKIHALGYVSTPDMFQLPLHSVDSSTWIQGSAKYGLVKVFTGHKMLSLSVREVLSKKLPPAFIAEMDELKVRPVDFMNKENLRGTYTLQIFLSIVAFIKYQKYCHMNGVKLFLALGSKTHLKQLIDCYKLEQQTKLTYDNFCNSKTAI